MINKIRSEIIYLYAIQISNVILPLITIPYLARVLGADFFGKFSYAQAISVIAIFIVDFGFNFSGAREVSINTSSRKKIDQIYSNIQISKILIYSVVLILGFLLFSFIPHSNIDALLLILTIAASISSVLMPSWFFQGVGRSSYVTFLNLATRLISLLMIFIFVKSKQDILIAAFLQLSAPVIAGIFMQCIIFKKKMVTLNIALFKKEISRSLLMESYHNFSASFFTLGFTYITPILIKTFLGDTILGIYSVADKLANVLRQFYNPLVQANFAIICNSFKVKEFAEIKKRIKKIFWIFTFLSCAALLGNFFLGRFVISYVFGSQYNIISLLSIMIITQYIVSISIIVVNLVIIPAGNSYYLKKVYFIALVLYLIIFYPMLNFMGVYGVALSISSTEFLIVIFFVKFIHQRKLLTK
ncbi:oligosaccharide flippase family protein [Klebsiella pneumoniae]|uniref:oligosaccharide flippase family protein n=1 Tax=Klebsiella pneumoniae TaxID=573 RepID=UPI003557A98D